MSSEIPISKITVTPWNPRKNFDPEELQELQQSIQQYGILEPLIVRPAGKKYELVAGERRFRAASAAGLKKVPVVVKELTDAEVHEIMLIENLQRSQLAPLEEAESLQVLLDQDEITQADLASKLGKSQAWIANRLRLLQAPEDLKALLISREISPKHVIAVLPLNGYPVMKEVTAELRGKLKNGSCSVSDFEEIIRCTITRSWQNESVLCLSDLPYEYNAYKIHLDRSGCDGCKDILKFKGNDRLYCLNTKCWKKKINQAKNKYEKQKAERTKKLAGKGIVDTSKLERDQYERLKYAPFDTSGCIECEHCRQTTDDNEICLDLKCFKKKKNAHQRDLSKITKLENERMWEAIDGLIDLSTPGSDFVLIGPEELSWVLRSLIATSWAEPTKKGLSRWKKMRSTDNIAVGQFMEEIDKKDLWPAIVRLICAQLMERNDYKSNEDILRDHIPRAAEFYQAVEA
jgi:ParB/RepB/Spo0J family partition protein